MNKFLVHSTLLFALLVATASPAAARTPTVAVIPLEGKNRPPGEHGHAALLKIHGTLAAMGGLNIVHARQMSSVLQHHDHRLRAIVPGARIQEIGRMLGADIVIHGDITITKAETSIDLRARSVRGRPSGEIKIRGATLIDVLDGIRLSVPKLLKKSGVKKPTTPAENVAGPVTRKLDAVLAFAGCDRILSQQTVGIQKPVVLNQKLLDEAIGRCLEAIRADSTMAAPKAALGFAYALAARRKDSERYLAMAKTSKAFQSYYWLGKFWVVSRYHNTNQSLSVLAEAVEKQPGFLLARGYLGEALIALKQYNDALKVFEDYLVLVKKQPWVLARLGYVHAKLGRAKKGVSFSQTALSIVPADNELRLELASRQVDAKRWSEAERTLLEIVKTGGARGEVHLRLGYVYLNQGHLTKAEREFRTALSKATHLSEWRTRGRARYDLAKVWMQAGLPDKAIEELRLAIKEGYRDKAKFQADKDLKRLAGHKEFQALMREKLESDKLPTLSSPFPIESESGKLAPVPKLEGKQETVILRF